jgi:hypothetical protein
MTRRAHVAFIAASLILPFVASQASATIVTKSFSGTIAGNRTTDLFGWFGTFGHSEDLSGATMTGSYTYDSSLDDFAANNSGVDSYVGEGTNAGAFTLTLSINGHSYSVSSSQFGQVETDSNDGTLPDTYGVIVDAANSDNFVVYTLVGAGEWVAGANPALIDSPIDFADTEQQFGISNASNQFNETLSFDVNSTEAPTSTPEPASTSLLLAGLLGLTAARLKRARGADAGALEDMPSPRIR